MDSQKIELTQKDIWRRVGLHIPFVLLVLFATVLIGGGAILFIYSFVTLAAMKSAMVFMIVFGGGVLAVGAGLGCIEAFRLYLGFYNEKEKFIERAPKTEIKKKPFSFSNVCLYIMVLGSVCVLISAALGSIKPETWVSERDEYMAENNYYAESVTFDVSYDVNDISADTVKIVLTDRNAVVIYTNDNSSRIRVTGYLKYQNQLCTAYGSNVLQIWETESPRQHRVKDNMLFFMFSDNKSEAQVRIYIPEYYKDSITITGDYVVAQD